MGEQFKKKACQFQSMVQYQEVQESSNISTTSLQICALHNGLELTSRLFVAQHAAPLVATLAGSCQG